MTEEAAMTVMIGGSYQLVAVRGGEQPQTRSTCFANDLLKQQSQVHHRDQFKRCSAPTYPTYQAQSGTKSEQSNSFTLPAVAQATGSFFTSPQLFSKTIFVFPIPPFRKHCSKLLFFVSLQPTTLSSTQV